MLRGIFIFFVGNICADAFSTPQRSIGSASRVESRTPLKAMAFGGLFGLNKDKSKEVKNQRVVIVGATGYIGKFVVQESIRRGYETVAVCRETSKPKDEYLNGAEIIFGDVTNPQSLQETAFKIPADVVISCLASRSGVKDDSYLIDYQATLNTLNVARATGAKHFILLSAFCVRKPLLQFQNAKLKFEEALINAGDIK